MRKGTENDFNETTNNEWLTQTRPILEAFWHTKYFLTMMAKWPNTPSSSTVRRSACRAVLYLFELR